MSEINSLFDSFPRGNPSRPNAASPQAAFQDEKRVLDSAALAYSIDNKEGKIFLGVASARVVIDAERPWLSDGRTNRYALHGHMIGIGDDRHMLTVAGSRAGKGRSVLVPNLLKYPGSILVIDPKTDLACITARRRHELGQNVLVLDPFGTGGDRLKKFAATFNPLDILLQSKSLLADAGLIADAIIVPSPHEKDPHWNECARAILEGLLLHVLTCEKYADRRDLVTVHELAWRLLVRATELSPAGEYALQIEMMENIAAGGAVRNAARDFYEKSDRERDSVLSTLRRHLHFLGYEELQRTLRSSSFDLRDLKRKQVTIYLSVPAMRLGTCNRWLRLFVNLTLASLEMERIRPPYPVLLCLDEFAVLGTMSVLEQAAGQIAGLGCKLWPILQDLAQLRALYSERWETFISNSGILQFFGNSDLCTLDFISKRLGTTTVINPSQSDVPLQSANASGATGHSWSLATAPLLSPSEIARFFGRDDELLRQLIIRPTAPPMVLQRAFYDRHAFFAGMFDPAVDGQ